MKALMAWSGILSLWFFLYTFVALMLEFERRLVKIYFGVSVGLAVFTGILLVIHRGF